MFSTSLNKTFPSYLFYVTLLLLFICLLFNFVGSFQLGVVCLEMKKPADAKIHLENALKNDPDHFVSKHFYIAIVKLCHSIFTRDIAQIPI